MMMSSLKSVLWVLRKNKVFTYLGLSLAMLLFSAYPCWSDGDPWLDISYDLAKYDPAAYTEACNVEKYNELYSEGCWSCDIVGVLMKSMGTAALHLGGLVTTLAMSVLLIGAGIWLAIFFLKSLGSPAQQDLGKVLDGAFLFMFKVAIVYALISGGVGGLIGQVVDPLLSIGVDIGSRFVPK